MKKPLETGTKAPEFSLPGVDGREHSLAAYARMPVLVVAFTCNHCPYVQAYEQRLIQFQNDFRQQGVQLICINSNDELNYPEDSFDRMKERAKQKAFNFPYLRDKDQTVAEAYGAQCTPHVFVLDKGRILRYNGRIDDNWKNSSQAKKQELRDAVREILAGKEVSVQFSPPIGCSIKWSQ